MLFCSIFGAFIFCHWYAILSRHDMLLWCRCLFSCCAPCRHFASLSFHWLLPLHDAAVRQPSLMLLSIFAADFLPDDAAAFDVFMPPHDVADADSSFLRWCRLHAYFDMLFAAARCCFWYAPRLLFFAADDYSRHDYYVAGADATIFMPLDAATPSFDDDAIIFAIIDAFAAFRWLPAPPCLLFSPLLRHDAVDFRSFAHCYAAA